MKDELIRVCPDYDYEGLMIEGDGDVDDDPQYF